MYTLKEDPRAQLPIRRPREVQGQDDEENGGDDEQGSPSPD